MASSSSKKSDKPNLSNDTTMSFADYVKTDSFVDNTASIKTVLEGDTQYLITAPKSFDKSGIMFNRMLKTFLEIQVDAEGYPVEDLKSTSNYKLFKDNKLKICEDEAFFNKYCGQYPVIFMEVETKSSNPRKEGEKYSFEEPLQRAFMQHAYLLKDTELWTDVNKREKFIEYLEGCSQEGWDHLDKGLILLSEILQRRFNKKSFILCNKYGVGVTDQDDCFGEDVLDSLPNCLQYTDLIGDTKDVKHVFNICAVGCNCIQIYRPLTTRSGATDAEPHIEFYGFAMDHGREVYARRVSESVLK